jgi:hypothetical protein
MSVAAIVAGVGGVLAIVGVPLAWASATMGGETTNLNGLDADLNGGKVALLLGILVVAVVAAGILNLSIPQPGAILAALGALLLVDVALVYFTSMLGKVSLKDTADLVSAAGGTFGFGIGLILVAVGGILALVGGGLIVAKKA